MNVEEYKKLAKAKSEPEDNIATARTESNKVWTKDRNGKMPYLIKLFLFSFSYVIVFCILMFVFMAISDQYSGLLITLAVIASIPVFVVFIKKNMSNFITFILYDGSFYRLMYTKQNISIRSDVLPIEALGAAYSMSGVQKAINRASNAGADIENTITEMSGDPNTWRIDKVKELKVHKHGFKAKVVVTVIMSDKTKTKKINILDDYIGYPLLLDTVNKLK